MQEMPKGGVNELLRSPYGRAHLQNLQKRYWKESLTPSDPRFKQVYRKQIAEGERLKEKNERISRDMKAESEERRGRGSKEKGGWPTKGKYI